MPKKALTAASVARLKPPATGQLDIYDRGYPGLFLRLSYGGTRTFSMAYRFRDKQRRITLGIWPAMQLAEARAAWRSIREQVARGVDPAGIKEIIEQTIWRALAPMLDRS